MNNKLTAKNENRNINLDIIRCIAIFSVISVHFFLNSGFYGTPVIGKRMYIMVLMRTFFMICVPLFLLLTGYLTNKYTLSKSYYLKIISTLFTYILASISCILFKKFYLGNFISLKSAFFSILNFSGSNYAWYVEMYIGLFVLIPFLNLVYNNLSSKKQKQALILTFFSLTVLPSVVNIFNFDSLSWWLNPTSSDSFAKLVPNWWVTIYPITYYYIGCYLKEFKINIKPIISFILILIAVLCFGSFNYYRCFGIPYKWTIYNSFGGFQSVVISVLVFIFISNFSSEKLPKLIKLMFVKGSELALGAYLVSYIFDSVIYMKLAEAIPEMIYRIDYFIIVVPIIFISSLLLSYILNILSTIIINLFKY